MIWAENMQRPESHLLTPWPLGTGYEQLRGGRRKIEMTSACHVVYGFNVI